MGKKLNYFVVGVIALSVMLVIASLVYQKDFRFVPLVRETWVAINPSTKTVAFEVESSKVKDEYSTSSIRLQDSERNTWIILIRSSNPETWLIEKVRPDKKSESMGLIRSRKQVVKEKGIFPMK
jgi:hypothetical protein